MKHVKVPIPGGGFLIHAEGPLEKESLCGDNLSDGKELPGVFENDNKITCPMCIAIIILCKSTYLQEYN